MKLFNSHFASQCNPVNNSSVPPLLEYKTNGWLVSVNIKHDIYPILGNRILKKLMNGTTDQLGWFNVAEKLLWNLYNFMSFLEEGVYPDYWKKSNVVPIHKKESKNLIENYRPICILPVFSKVFERIILNSLFNHFLENKLNWMPIRFFTRWFPDLRTPFHYTWYI